MDPLSISASLVALLQLTGTVLQYLTSMREGPKKIQQIRLELASIQSTLMILQYQGTSESPENSLASSMKSLNMPMGPFDQFRAVLERLAKKLAPLEGWKRVGKAIQWPFEKEEIQEMLNTIERYKTIFILAQQNDTYALAEAIQTGVDETGEKVDGLANEMTDLRVGEQRRRIQKWLSAPDPSTNYLKALKLHHGDTGNWVFGTRSYLRWLAEPGQVLWLYGIPGCGKTVLSSIIIQSLEHYCRLDQNKILLYFYFDFNDSEKQRHEKLLRALVVQLFAHCVEVPVALEDLFSSCLMGQRQPPGEYLLSILNIMSASFKDVFLVLDALDECVERQEVLISINELISHGKKNLRILMTSRNERDIEESMQTLCKDGEKLNLQNAFVNDDINAYVSGRLQTDRKLGKWQRRTEIKQEILMTLTENANGMFRWAACQLDSLSTCLNSQELRKALKSLPKTLNDTYARILCQINEEHRHYALKILQWLAYSERPLKLDELSEVIAIDPKAQPRFDCEKRLLDPRDILQICSSMISIYPKFWAEDSGKDLFLENESEVEAILQCDPGGMFAGYEDNKFDYVRLAHFSVKEFLVSSEISAGEASFYSLEEHTANKSMADDCLSYLLHFDDMDSLNFSFLEEFPLAEYAARYWTQHFRTAEDMSEIEPSLVMELLLTKGNALLNWVRLCNPERHYIDLELTFDRIGTPLFYASVAKLYKPMKILIANGADVNESNRRHSILHMVSMDDQKDMVQELLGKGADINATNVWQSTALQQASREDLEDVVHILLENGADVNAGGTEGGSALQNASNWGHVNLVRVLLQNGADIDACSFELGTALQAASLRGWMTVAQILLEKGANVNIRGGRYGTALCAASSNGREEMVQILLENGADVNAPGPDGTALQDASSEGHEAVVQVLLQFGADVNARSDKHGTALQAASLWGYEAVVKMLLEHGADVNARGGMYGTAVLAASARGYNEVVKILLENGAFSGNQPPVDGHQEVGHVSLDNGADVDVK